MIAFLISETMTLAVIVTKNIVTLVSKALFKTIFPTNEPPRAITMDDLGKLEGLLTDIDQRISRIESSQWIILPHENYKDENNYHVYAPGQYLTDVSQELKKGSKKLVNC